MGRGEANGDQNHIKVISEVQAFQPLPLNHWGVAVEAKNVHFNIVKKPEGKGQTTPTTTTPCATLPPFSTICWLATGSPPEAHKQSRKNHTAFTEPKCTQIHHNGSITLPTQRADLISCVSEATTTSHNHTNFTPSLPFLWPSLVPRPRRGGEKVAWYLLHAHARSTPNKTWGSEYDRIFSAFPTSICQ